MSAVGYGDLVSHFVDHGGFVAMVVVAVFVLATFRPVARRFETSEHLAAAALLSIATIVAITLGVRLLEDGGIGLGFPRLACLANDSCLDRIVAVDASWVLNLVIFVPAGLSVVLATRRPALTAGGLIALSGGIELLQGVTGLGAPDPGDIAANTIGALVGAALGAVVLGALGQRVTDPAHARSRRALFVSVFAATAIAGFAWLALVTAANARRASLADDIREAFAGTTSADIASALATPDGSDRLFATTATRPGYLGQVGTTGVYEARYSTRFFGFDRCVFARWDDTGIELSNGSGRECSVFRDGPPG